MSKKIGDKTSFLEDTFRAYLTQTPEFFQRESEFEEGALTLNPYSDLDELRSGRMHLDINYLEPDPEFNWVQQLEEDGYDMFRNHLADHNITNKRQYDVAINTIKKIQSNARQFNQSDRFWGPMIASQFMQLETYALLPFTFGAGVGIGAAVKGGFKAAAVNMATEIPRETTRIYYDPYYNETHSLFNFGLAGAFGGVLGALPPLARGGMKSWRNRGIGQKTKYDNMSHENVVKESFEQWYTKYGNDLDIDFSLKLPGLSRSAVRKNAENGTNKYIDLKTGKAFVRDKKQRRAISKKDLYIPVKLKQDDVGLQTLEIDKSYMEYNYQLFKRGKTIPNIPGTFNKFIKTRSDFENFIIRKEVYRDLDYVQDLPVNIKNKELALNTKVMQDLIDENKMSFQTREMVPPINIGTDHFKIDITAVNTINRMMEKLSPLTKYNNKFKNDSKLYFKANHLISSLINDNGIKLQASNKGFSINDSVYTTKDTIFGKHQLKFETELNDLYLNYLGRYKEYNDLNKGLQSSYNSLKVSAERMTEKTKQFTEDKINKLLNKKTEKLSTDEPFTTHMTRPEFNKEITRLLANPDLLENTKIPELREAVIATRRFYDMPAKIIEREEMMGYAPKAKQFREIQTRIKRITAKLEKAKEGTGQHETYKKLLEQYEKRQEYLSDVIEELNDGTLKLKKIPKNDVKYSGIMPANESKETFFHRIHIREAYVNYPKQAKARILDDLLNYHPDKETYRKLMAGDKKSKAEVFNKVNEKYLRIVSRDHMDELNLMEHYKDKKVNPTIHRGLYGPNKNFLEDANEGIKFIEDDVVEISRQYTQQIGTAIQMNRIFGDKMGFFKKLELVEDIADRVPLENVKPNIENAFPFVRDIKKSVTGKMSLDEINAIVRNFEDQVYNLYGLHNRIAPNNFSKRLIENLMNYTITTTMGNAGLSGMAEMARRVTVHGIKKAGLFPGKKFLSGTYGKSYKALNDAMREQLDKQASELYTHMEIIASNGYLSRLVNTDMGAINKDVGKNILSKTINFAERANRGAARATYLANGQTHLTHFLKTDTSGMSSHYFVKDLLALHKNKLDGFGIDRLKQYGLNKKDAKIINDLLEKDIIEKVSKPGRDPLYLLNMDRWVEVKGAVDISERFINAIKQDVERAIVTPGYSSKPNMMYGRIQIDNRIIADFLGESKLLKALNKYSGGLTGEFHSLQYGGLYENPLLIPIMQFYAFSMGATRYIFRNLPAEQGVYAGITAAMAYSWFANNLKYGWYSDLDIDQQLYMAYETSGVGGYFSDVPRIIETETQGKYGLRKILGIDELDFGQDQDRRGATLIGIGPQKLRELYGAMSSGDALEQSSQTVRNLPFQNNMILKRGWQILGTGGNTFYSPVVDWLYDIDRDRIKRKRKLKKKDRFGKIIQ